MTQAECKERLDTEYFGCKKFYMLSLGKNICIDAKKKGNFARFINHSCDPNLVSSKWSAKGRPRMAFFAVKIT